MRLVFSNLAHLELDVDDAGSIHVVVCRTLADDLEPVAPSSLPVFDYAAAGRHGNHVRYGQRDPACSQCVVSPPDRPPIAPDRPGDSPPTSDRIDSKRDLDSIDLEGDAAGSALIDLPRPDVAALRQRWSRGGRSTRPVFLTPEALARLDRVAACAEHDREWSAAVIRDAGGQGRRDLLGHLERTHDELHRPAPVAPEQLAAAAEVEVGRRRRAYQEQLEREDLTPIARAALERSLARLEGDQEAQPP